MVIKMEHSSSRLSIYIVTKEYCRHYFHFISVIFLLNLCCHSLAVDTNSDTWPEGTVHHQYGHYPPNFCTFTNLAFNSTDGVFYYKSSKKEHDICSTVNDIWTIKHNPWLQQVQCDETYDLAVVFLFYYWHGSNYYHLHYDTLIPLYSLIYEEQKIHGKVLFMPSVEKRRLQNIDWDTRAFEDDTKYWMHTLKFISGGYQMKPLHRNILNGKQNICFKKIHFGTPIVNFADKVLIKEFIKFAKHRFQIDKTPNIKPKLAIVSRKVKRKILNEADLVNAANKVVPTDLLDFSGMSFKDQVAVMSKYTVFAAVNGAGLMNALYLPPHAVTIQLVPYKAHLNFEQYSVLLKSRGPYLEWHNKHAENHFPAEGDTHNNRANTKVHVEEFVQIVKQALEISKKVKKEMFKKTEL